MQKVLLYSGLLLLGLLLSQTLPAIFPNAWPAAHPVIELATMFFLTFIMIHVGLEFDIDKSKARSYGWDFMVAFSAAALPWIFCAIYFAFIMSSGWKESIVVGLFSAPTSAGILFSMLAAAGLSTTWVFKKARVLAIFDDLATLLLLIPLKILMMGLQWQVVLAGIFIVVLLIIAWVYLRAFSWPTTWPWVLFYSAVVTLGCRLIHFEVLLPAFVLGCVLASSHHSSPSEEKASTWVTAFFLIFVGLSMPWVLAPRAEAIPFNWGMIATHVAIVTVIANLGKMLCLLCYRKEATLRERLALSIAMWPRGEVGAGILTIALTFGVVGADITVAMISLTLNLICTGVFIAAVKKLISSSPVSRLGS